jgi:hypothetical protein
MFLQAAVVIELPAVLGVVDAVQQPFIATRTMQRVAQGLAQVVAVHSAA